MRLGEGGILCVELKCMVSRIFAGKPLAVVAVAMLRRPVLVVLNLKT